MKKNVFVILVSLLLLPTPMFSDNVVVKGPFGKNKGRSLILTPVPPPDVSVDNRLLSIYLEEALTNLVVIIADSNNNIVYQGNISTYIDGSTYTISLNDLPEGDYTITFLHNYGNLTGEFTL